MINEKVTILIKSFLRPNSVRALVESIRVRYPKIKIIIVDDSNRDYQLKSDDNISVYYLPFDSGLSKGRNYGVERVTTPYFVLCDDDMIFNDNTNLELSLDIISSTDLDILGGNLYDGGKIVNYFGLLEKKGETLYYNKGNRGVYDNYTKYDLILNFFIAKTESIMKYKWDDDLKVAEHTAFFYDNKNNLNVGHTDKFSISHQKRVINKEYEKFRWRNEQFFGVWLKKRGIKEVKKNI